MKRKKKNIKANAYFVLIYLILIFLTISNFYFVFKINIFPFKYLILFLVLFLLSVIILFFYMKTKKQKNKKILSVLVTIFSILFLVMFLYFSKTFVFFKNIMSKNYKVENYIIVANKDSKFENINDLLNKKILYIETDIYDISEAIKVLKSKLIFQSMVTDDYEKMLNCLYNNEVDAILIEESYKELLVSDIANEENNSFYSSFNEKTKVIYSFEIKIENETDTTDVNVLKEPFNIYISGIDTYGEISSVSRSDVNIIVTVNPTTKQILLTTIPRDYYVSLNGKEGYKDKLTHAGIYGIETSKKTIEYLLNINIDYYIKVNFSSLIKLVDAVGGIEVYSEYDFSSQNYTFKKGYNKMNGKKALEFSRTRKTLVTGDRARGKNQEAVIVALIDKICSKSIITNYISILNSLEDTFITNMQQSKITELIKMQLNDMTKWNITSIALDGINGFDYTYSYKKQKLYVMIPIESTIVSAKEKINYVCSGIKLESSYTN